MTARSYRVRVFDTHEAWRDWLDGIPTETGENPHYARVRHIEATGETALQLDGNQFFWICPGCGMACGGSFGEQPVSGWDNPRWVNSGTLERPTLTPSLGCPEWKRGECGGRWWLRDGELIPA